MNVEDGQTRVGCRGEVVRVTREKSICQLSLKEGGFENCKFGVSMKEILLCVQLTFSEQVRSSLLVWGLHETATDFHPSGFFTWFHHRFPSKKSTA